MANQPDLIGVTSLHLTREHLEYAVTPTQKKYLEAYLAFGSCRKAGDAMGVHQSRISAALRAIKSNAETHGYAPDYGYENQVPESFYASKISTLYDADGGQKLQWVQAKPDLEERYKAIMEIIQTRAEQIEPRPPVPLPTVIHPDEDLCNLITLTDCHVGALAWAREAGEDWDLNIAKETLTRIFTGMINSMPPAGTCIINQLGDFLHTDGLVPVTPAHGHILDADGRYQKISEYAVEILEDIIVAALQRHGRVHVIMAEGNHDESSSAWLRVMFKRIFRDDPRVTVDDGPLPYYAYQHGQVMLCFHHGHKLKPSALPMWFATKYSQMWGNTVTRYGHSGHQHHLDEKDHMGLRWLQHPTIAASDAYSARGGWISPREAIGITYDLEGEVSRLFVRPKMFRDPEANLAQAA